jgi:hypothetical protein
VGLREVDGEMPPFVDVSGTAVGYLGTACKRRRFAVWLEARPPKARSVTAIRLAARARAFRRGALPRSAASVAVTALRFGTSSHAPAFAVARMRD